jgi:endonuclease I
MKKITFLLLITLVSIGFAQNGAPAQPYYNGFNWNLNGMALKIALETKTISKHTNFLTYTPDVWNASKITDLDPNNSNNVLLLYGWENGTDTDLTNDHSRDKNLNGGNSGEWNREHVYAKSLGIPVLDDGSASPSDAGEDAHHLRSCDVQRNNTRGNSKFAAGSGNSSLVTVGWYPGDEWKGDVARMIMYMYLRYGSQCLPTNVGVGLPVASDSNMIDLFLTWNSQDPVSQYEDNRNTYHGNTSNTYAQGNRNPFIDNPYLATVIWGGPIAQNRWPNIFLDKDVFNYASISVYPNPSNDHKVIIESDVLIDTIQLININGQLMMEVKKPTFTNNSYTLENLPQGFYFLKLGSENQSLVKKLIVN